jgi:hypothetical protein
MTRDSDKKACAKGKPNKVIAKRGESNHLGELDELHIRPYWLEAWALFRLALGVLGGRFIEDHALSRRESPPLVDIDLTTQPLNRRPVLEAEKTNVLDSVVDAFPA